MGFSPSVAIVIAFKNELPKLKQHVPQLLNQEYPNFKLYFVDDHSTDEGANFLHSLADEKIVVIQQSDDHHGKKRALSLAINEVKEEWVLCTDADCYPESNQWISQMMRHAETADMVLGYSPPSGEKSWLNGWISFETWFIALQYFSASLLGRPYMGVGRNIAYRKSLFDGLGGFASHEHIKSGDDDLFISQLEKDHKVEISLSRKSWMWTLPKDTFRAYIRQKRRHLTTAPHYKVSTQIWLMALFVTQLVWYIAVVTMLFKGFWLMSLGLLVLRCLLISTVLLKRPLEWQVGLLKTMGYDVGLCIFYLTLSFAFLFPKKEW